MIYDTETTIAAWFDVSETALEDVRRKTGLSQTLMTDQTAFPELREVSLVAS